MVIWSDMVFDRDELVPSTPPRPNHYCSRHRNATPFPGFRLPNTAAAIPRVRRETTVAGGESPVDYVGGLDPRTSLA
jgi:hypothetical protein